MALRRACHNGGEWSRRLRRCPSVEKTRSALSTSSKTSRNFHPLVRLQERNESFCSCSPDTGWKSPPSHVISARFPSCQGITRFGFEEDSARYTGRSTSEVCGDLDSRPNSTKAAWVGPQAPICKRGLVNGYEGPTAILSGDVAYGAPAAFMLPC